MIQLFAYRLHSLNSTILRLSIPLFSFGLRGSPKYTTYPTTDCSIPQPKFLMWTLQVLTHIFRRALATSLAVQVFTMLPVAIQLPVCAFVRIMFRLATIILTFTPLRLQAACIILVGAFMEVKLYSIPLQTTSRCP